LETADQRAQFSMTGRRGTIRGDNPPIRAFARSLETQPVVCSDSPSCITSPSLMMWAKFKSEVFIAEHMAQKVHAAHILVKDEKAAKDIAKRLQSGERFSDLARKHSDCPSGAQGGDLGWFGKGQMVKEFEDACFSERKGAILGPVKTQFGWHVIQVLEER